MDQQSKRYLNTLLDEKLKPILEALAELREQVKKQPKPKGE